MTKLIVPNMKEKDLRRLAQTVFCAKAHLKKLRDTRRLRGRRFVFLEVILMGLMGMVCGCNDAEALADWAELHSEWLVLWFELEHGTPSQDTFLRLFEIANPKVLSEATRRWLASLRPRLAKHIAIDGKTLRGSRKHSQQKPAVHLVSAWLREAGLVLGQVKTHAKSNEIKAIPALLNVLDIEGCILTIDAAGCQRKIAAQIIKQGGHYVLAVKGNQPTLHDAISWFFLMQREQDFADVRVSRYQNPG